MVKVAGVKCTPNERAKMELFWTLETAWLSVDDDSDLTAKEKNEVEEALVKQMVRVEKLLGVEKLRTKLFDED